MRTKFVPGHIKLYEKFDYNSVAAVDPLVNNNGNDKKIMVILSDLLKT